MRCLGPYHPPLEFVARLRASIDAHVNFDFPAEIAFSLLLPAPQGCDIPELLDKEGRLRILQASMNLGFY